MLPPWTPLSRHLELAWAGLAPYDAPYSPRQRCLNLSLWLRLDRAQRAEVREWVREREQGK